MIKKDVCGKVLHLLGKPFPSKGMMRTQAQS
jgi:hypothetical protein